MTQLPKITEMKSEADAEKDKVSVSVTSVAGGQVTGSESNNNKEPPKDETPKAKNNVLSFDSIFDRPKMKGVVFKAMAKDRDDKLKENFPPRRQSGPSRYGSTLTLPVPAMPDLLNRRKSDIGLRRVRKTSSTLNFRRLSLSAPTIEEEDPLEYLLQVAGTPVTSESRGAYRRFSSILNQEHVTGLCSGFTLGVSAALVLKSVLLLLMVLWSFTPG